MTNQNLVIQIQTHNQWFMTVSIKNIYYIPDSYVGTSPIPLMLNFHGFGGNASYFMNYANMRAVAESNTFILGYPQVSCADGSAYWGPCPGGIDHKSTIDDLGFVTCIINEISSQYIVDLERIYAAKYSNEDMMA